MRSEGVLVFEAEGIKIALGPAPVATPEEKRPAPRKMSYDDLLFAASEGLPAEAE